jgi:membrane fusion protein (multidrug efflux system)
MADRHEAIERDRAGGDHKRSDAEALREDERQAQPPSAQDGNKPKQDGAGRREARRRSPWPRLILAAVVLVAVIGGTWYYFATKDLETTDDAYTDGRAVTIAPHVSGYVTTLLVNDNQFVHAGDVLIEIDPRDYKAARDQAQGQLDIAKGQLQNARYALATAKVNFPARLAAAQAQLEQAKANLFNTETEYKRQHSIAPAATTQQAIDQATANFQSAQAQVAAAGATVRENTPVPELIGESDAQVKQLEGQVIQAQAQLDQANLNLSWTKVRAPQDGWITKRNVEMGNYVQSGQSIFSIVTPEVWVTANFKETQLNRMRPGQKVKIDVDAYPGLNLEGHVDSVQLGSGSKFTAFPPENATGNFVKIVQRVPVKILIDHGLDPNLPLPLGISVEPTVHLK